jgi:SAM-dependent methyltransferase
VYYQRCPNCGHIEAPQFRRWSAERFISEIYNAEYISLDPDFQRRRPLSNAEFLHRTDPFVDNAPLNRELYFDLVTAFEVFEHVPDPNQLMRSIVELMSERGVLIFSTLLSDAHVVPGERLTWWYAAPRNGHVSLYSRKSLSHLAGNFGMRLHSWNDGLHCMYRWLPDWVQTVIRPCGI